MADSSSAGQNGRKGRLLKAKALDESPPQAIPVDTPPAPIPVQPVPVQTTPPAPIRVDPQTPTGPAPLRPIPVTPAQVGPVHVGPVQVGPNTAVADAAPIAINTGGRHVAVPAAPERRPAVRQSPASAAPTAGAATGAVARPVLLTEEQKAKASPQVTAHRGAKATGVREELAEAEEEGRLALVWRDFLKNQPSWLVSLVFHLAVLVLLGVLTLTMPRPAINLVSLPEPEELDFSELAEVNLEKLERGPEALDIVDRDSIESLEPMIDMEHAAEGLNAASLRPLPMMTEIAPLNDHFFDEGRGTGTARQRGTGKGDKGDGWGLAGSGQGLGGRGGRRGKAVGRGATPESEKAVNLALEWLVHHQLVDGGWSFDHTIAPDCQGKCGDPGEENEARIAATALGVLPFLGAGQTHQVGKYKQNVKAALMYLIASMKIGRDGGSLYDAGRGKMYSHGLATIALCEAYAMCIDPKELIEPKKFYDGGDMPSPGEIKSLREKQEDRKKAEVDNEFNAALGRAAQLALNFIVTAQHEAGGWRYEPRQAGDTSVVGWQVMALKSGQMAKLQVNPATLAGAVKYLQSVQIGDYGDDYGYTDPTKGTIATQAIGLLCRMYLGWPHDHPGLQKGVEAMDGKGPSRNNMYFNYYATQVVHHYGGEPWKRWNPQMRDMLVARQSHNGHETGSWYFDGDHGSGPGGRLYITALAAMTLEVYYRHMPLYRQDIFGEEKDKDQNADEKAEPNEAPKEE